MARPGALLVARQFLEDGLVKLLSKRTRGSGEISVLVVGSTMGRRFPLHPERPLRKRVIDERWLPLKHDGLTGGR